jgi:urea transport system permease protein
MMKTLWTRYRVIIGIVIALAFTFAAPMMLSDFRLGLMSKYLCYAMIAVGIGLAWGKGGMLTLGQGVYFGLGAYIMAMHMKLVDAGPGGVPDFMVLYGSGELPGWWEPFRNPAFALAAVILVPTLVAALLGWCIFSRGVRGAYFAILSQALAAAFATFLIGQQKTTGGTNGLNNFKGFFGYALTDPVNRQMLFYLCAFVLIAMVLVSWWIRRSFMGDLLVGVRDQENRMKFLGYEPASIKVFTYSLSALFAGVAGALFVPVVGIISPANVGVIPSILMLSGVVLGGRATLLGPVIGTIAVRFAETQLSEAYPSAWTYVQGLLFILVIAFLPAGLGGLGKLWPWITDKLGIHHGGASSESDAKSAAGPAASPVTTKGVLA